MYPIQSNDKVEPGNIQVVNKVIINRAIFSSLPQLFLTCQIFTKIKIFTQIRINIFYKLYNRFTLE